jgi:hypothetical protein
MSFRVVVRSIVHLLSVLVVPFLLADDRYARLQTYPKSGTHHTIPNAQVCHANKVRTSHRFCLGRLQQDEDTRPSNLLAGYMDARDLSLRIRGGMFEDADEFALKREELSGSISSGSDA